MPIERGLYRCVIPLFAITLAGCAALPAERGIADVQALIAARGGYQFTAADANTSALVTEKLKAPLTANDVVQIALLNNPRMRTEYARLGVASAEVYDAGRLTNPRFSAASLNSSATGAADQVSFGLAQSFTDLLLLPMRSRLAKGEFERAKQQAGQAILDLVAEVETAYFNLVGAQQVTVMRRKIARAAHAAADLAQRFFAAGNISARELAQTQAAASTAQLSALQARSESNAARLTLNELLGLGTNVTAWQTGDTLPLPLEREPAIPELLILATQSRHDLAALQQEVALLTDSLRTTRRYRYVGAIEVGVETERETDRSRITGPTLSLELPIFNQGAGKVARAEALVEQAESALHALELKVANAVMLAATRVAAARERAELLRTRLIPQREEVVRRTQQEVSFMLEGQFTLLLVKQQEYDAYQAYLEALRDYWVARTALTREVGTRLPAVAAVSAGNDHTPSGATTAETPHPPPAVTPTDAAADPHHQHGDLP